MPLPSQKILQPGCIGKLEIPNRIVKSAVASSLANIDGSVSERLLSHYRETAKGGSGLVVVESAYIDCIASKSFHSQLSIAGDDYIPGLSLLARTIQETGAKAGIQIGHGGNHKLVRNHTIKSASDVSWPHL